MSLTVFDVLAHPLSQRQTVHNVRLLEVRPAEDGQERLILEHEGVQGEIVGGGRWNEEYSRRDLGRVGYVELAPPTVSLKLQKDAYYFRAYLDPSLRRVPQLDVVESRSAEDDRGAEVRCGWRCDAKPRGFLAPAGIIPGERGEFVPDNTIAVTVRVPPEYVREAERVQLTPKALLKSFIGDLAGIQNFIACPRADGYGSNGSDERNYAEAWLERAHGMNAIDLDELDQRRDEEKQKEIVRDELISLLDEYEDAGGDPEDLISAVQAIVDRENEA